MAENLESYHVQHQTHHNNNNFHNPQFYPLYDPSQLLTPDFLTTDPNPTRIRIRPEEQSQMIKTNTFYVDGAPDHHFNGDAGTTLFFKPEPLSLSLSNSHHNNQRNGISGCYEAVPGGFDGGGGGGSGVTRCTVPLGPFTGYASILKGSKFLKPAQTLLEEFCDVGSAVCAERVLDGEDLFMSFDPTAESLSAAAAADGGGESITGKKSKLISMLDEVYRKYKEYFQQLQLAVASFECIPGLGNAAPYAILASKALSKHFKCLKKAITDQLQFTSKTRQDHGDKGQCHPSFGNASDARAQRPGLSEHQPPVWRPQRGLPERAVAVLRAWLFDHFLHPYPTDTDKLMLAKQTGLSRNQVSNWFINARVRLWKPMVEEIHLLETRQSQKAGFQRDDSTRRNPNRNPNISSSISNLPENPSNSKRTRNDVLPNGFTDYSNLSYHHRQNHHHHHIGTGVQSLGANGVSLTLGLQYQNNGVVGLSSDGNNYNSISAAAVERFGLGGGGGGGDGYVMGGNGGFEGQNRQFGRDHVLGGHFLHDFVG